IFNIDGNPINCDEYRQCYYDHKVFSDVGIFSTSYGYRSESRSELNYQDVDESNHVLNITSAVQDLGARANFDILPNARHYIKVGGTITHHEFRPETLQRVSEATSLDSTTSLTQSQPTLRSWEASAYIQDNFALTQRLRVNAGLHFSAFTTDGTTYSSLQPRLSARYLLPRHFALKASYSTMVQYLHLLSNSGVGLPIDLWVPSTPDVPPQRAQQVAAGISKRIPKLGLEFSVECYYKQLTDLIDYETGVNFIGSRDWQNLIATDGMGWSYGLEFLVRRTEGRFNGWLGYTLSRTDRQFAAINEGNKFPYKYDRRHDLSIALSYDLGKRMTISATWIYGSGAAITLPEGVHLPPTSPILGFWDLNERPGLGVIINYGDRNSFRLPAYHRLDLNFKMWKPVSWGEIYWNFGIFNAYNRQNPFFLFLRADYANNPNIPEIKARKMSLLPILPVVNFGFKF
ncbi:MAG: TonB-dependent receptor, partial [Bacteroidota bacterium]